MRGFLYLTLGGLLVVALSALPPETARWFALGLLGLIVITPAVGRRVQGGAEDPSKPREERGY